MTDDEWAAYCRAWRFVYKIWLVAVWLGFVNAAVLLIQ